MFNPPSLIDKLNSGNITVRDIATILDDISSCRVNWLGSREISTNTEPERYCKIDTIANKLLEISSQEGGDGLSFEEKKWGKNCEKALKKLYVLCDDEWKKSNIGTYTIGFLSRVIFEGYGNSFSEDCASARFQILDGQITENMKEK